MTKLKGLLLYILYKNNVKSDIDIEDLADEIEQIFNDFIVDDWSVDDCK